MKITSQRFAAGTGAAVLALVALTACGDDDSSETPTPEATTEEAPVEEETTEEAPAEEETTEEEASEEEPAEEEPVAGGSGDYTEAEWARPVTTEGELVATAEFDGGLSVDVYQVDVVSATRDSMWVDPESEEPIIAEGDDIVYFNYVFRNDGDPIDLGFSLVNVRAEYDDWPYMGGMSGLSDTAQFEQLGLNTLAIETGRSDQDVFTVGTGEWFAQAANYGYQPGSTIEFRFDYTPLDEAGERISEEAQEVRAEAVVD